MIEVKPHIVDGSKILDGAGVFKLMDTKGLPLEVINEILRAEGCGFNVIQFIEAALASGNFTYKTIKRKLISAFRGDTDMLSQLLDSIADKYGWKPE